MDVCLPLHSSRRRAYGVVALSVAAGLGFACSTDVKRRDQITPSSPDGGPPPDASAGGQRSQDGGGATSGTGIGNGAVDFHSFAGANIKLDSTDYPATCAL